MARQVAYGILCFVIGLIASTVALLTLVNNTQIIINDTLFVVLIFIIPLLTGLGGAKIAGREDNVHPKGSYVIMGGLLGFIIAGTIAQNLSSLSFPILDYIWPHNLILIIGLIGGGLLGSYIGNRILDRKLEQRAQSKNWFLSFFSWFAYASKRIEGDYIIYTVDNRRYQYLGIILLVVGGILYRTQYKYWWIVAAIIIVYLGIGGLAKTNDSMRAKSKKIMVVDKRISEHWYQIE